MGRFQLELIYFTFIFHRLSIKQFDGKTVENKGKLILTETSHRCKNMIFKRINLPLLFTVLPSNSRLFLSCRSFVVITTFSTPTRPVENVITTKGLQDRNDLLLDGRTVENKGKLILKVRLIKSRRLRWQVM